MGVEPKIGGGSPKMDGENNGKPYFPMDDLGWKHPLFLETSIYKWDSLIPYPMGKVWLLDFLGGKTLEFQLFVGKIIGPLVQFKATANHYRS